MTQRHLPYAEIIVNPSLTLRQLQLDDAPTIFKLVDNNREYLGQFVTWVGSIKASQDMEDFIQEMLVKRQKGQTFGYGVFVEGQLVGHASLMHINDGEDPEIGYWIASNMSGRGIGTQVAKALVKLGFNSLDLDKIYIIASVNNTGSNKVAEKLGAVLERQEHNPRIGTDLANVWSVSR